jgi:hypothetical protein
MFKGRVKTYPKGTLTFKKTNAKLVDIYNIWRFHIDIQEFF